MIGIGIISYPAFRLIRKITGFTVLLDWLTATCYLHPMKLIFPVIVASFISIGLTVNAQETLSISELNKKNLFIAPVGALAYYGSKELGSRKDHNFTVNQIARFDRNDVNRFWPNATYHWNRSMDKKCSLPKLSPLFRLHWLCPVCVKKWNHALTLAWIPGSLFLLMV